MAGLASAITNISFVKAVSYFPVGIVSTLIFCNVFVIMIISRIVFKSPITLRKVGAAIFAILGVCLVLDVFRQGFHHNFIGLYGYFLQFSPGHI
ncbi:EamA family transporter [Desulfosporosinus orientis]|uniref:EamA family transporter n=1 Tax=Desulfosporosinus orientis TaxID=1563 RepID=UPI001305322F